MHYEEEDWEEEEEYDPWEDDEQVVQGCTEITSQKRGVKTNG